MLVCLMCRFLYVLLGCSPEAEKSNYVFEGSSCARAIWDQVLSLGRASLAPSCPRRKAIVLCRRRGGLAPFTHDATFHYGTHNICITQNCGFVSQGRGGCPPPPATQNHGFALEIGGKSDTLGLGGTHGGRCTDVWTRIGLSTFSKTSS